MREARITVHWQWNMAHGRSGALAAFSVEAFANAYIPRGRGRPSRATKLEILDLYRQDRRELTLRTEIERLEESAGVVPVLWRGMSALIRAAVAGSTPAAVNCSRVQPHPPRRARRSICRVSEHPNAAPTEQLKSGHGE